MTPKYTFHTYEFGVTIRSYASLELFPNSIIFTPITFVDNTHIKKHNVTHLIINYTCNKRKITPMHNSKQQPTVIAWKVWFRGRKNVHFKILTSLLGQSE